MTYLSLPESALDEELPQTVPLAGYTLVLGICGSIAALKSQQLASLMVRAGVRVRVVLTEGARQFVGPWAFRGIVGEEPYLDMFSAPEALSGEPHIALARNADAMLIMPASATCISRLATAAPADPVSLVALNVPPDRLFMAPAMSHEMWSHGAVQDNVRRLQDLGVTILGPARGRLASGSIGDGRLVEPYYIAPLIKAFLARQRGDLRGLQLVVSAGGTRQPVDSVRYIGNRSSGRQGHAIAEAARDRGAEVTLVTSQPEHAPLGINRIIKVESHADFAKAIEESVRTCDCYVGAAAIADYTPLSVNPAKIKREASNRISIDMEGTKDIIAGLNGPFIKVAFAAEVGDHVANARAKLERKGADLIVLNDVSKAEAGFSSRGNRVTIINKEGVEFSYPEGASAPPLDKYDVAWRILDHVKQVLYQKKKLLGAP